MAIAADSFDEFLRAFTVFRTDLIQWQNEVLNDFRFFKDLRIPDNSLYFFML
jgi:hypothetical protein